MKFILVCLDSDYDPVCLRFFYLDLGLPCSCHLDEPFVVVIYLRQKNYSLCPRGRDEGSGFLWSTNARRWPDNSQGSSAVQKNVDKPCTLRGAACILLYEWLMGQASEKACVEDTLWGQSHRWYFKQKYSFKYWLRGVFIFLKKVSSEERSGWFPQQLGLWGLNELKKTLCIFLKKRLNQCPVLQIWRGREEIVEQEFLRGKGPHFYNAA